MPEPTIEPQPPVSPRRNFGKTLLIIFLCWYGFLTFGGIRSPDEEIVWRTGESLVIHGSFAAEDIPTWPGFGLAQGRDGRKYSIFGPLQSIALAPFIAVAKVINTTEWYSVVPVPVSMFVGTQSQPDYYIGPQPVNTGPHALRFLSSFFILLVSALVVREFFKTLLALGSGESAAFFTAVLMGAGTLVQAYAATLFTEPLATLLMLAAFRWLIEARRLSEAGPSGEQKTGMLISASGLMLGLSAAAHITSMLAAPFFMGLMYFGSTELPRAERVKNSGVWLAGFGIALLLLAVYNGVRFGDVLETGRAVDPVAAKNFAYGYFVAPWLGLYGLSLSMGKGLLWYSPLLLLAAPGWTLLWRRNKQVTIFLASMALFRFVFIASRYDWAGGFCLGPRFLVPLIPFLCLPLGVWIDDIVRRREFGKLMAGAVYAALCVLQQWYCSLGDTFLFYYRIVRNYQGDRVHLFESWDIYRNAEYSPLLHFMSMVRAPFMLKSIPVTNEVVFGVGAIVILGGLAWCCRIAIVESGPR